VATEMDLEAIFWTKSDGSLDTEPGAREDSGENW
jgi:hypothetical protein